MQQPSLSGLVRRRLIYHIANRGLTTGEVVCAIGIAPANLCKLIAGQDIAQQPLSTLVLIARWLKMSLKNVSLLAHRPLQLDELMILGMLHDGYRPTSTEDQVVAAQHVGVSVAVFRRALHRYPDFRPSLRTCEQIANWLAWTGYDLSDVAGSAGVLIRHRTDGRALTTPCLNGGYVGPYPCACGRTGCFVPAHIPKGPRRIWHSDACRMWVRRQTADGTSKIGPDTPLPHRQPIARFILINEHAVPVRF